MPDINPLAIALAAVVTFLISGAYYSVLGNRLARLSPAYAEPGGPNMGTTIVTELVRSTVVAVVITGLVGGLGVDRLGPALLLAFALWVAFPAVLLVGSVVHDRVPPLLAAIHVGDWLLKLVAITGIVTVWH